MEAETKTQNFVVNESSPIYPISNASFRNLKKSELGGVIFGCKNTTIKECLSKQLFGLPAQHFSFVKNIDPGLPLFLFNCNDRKLHGIFEAASSGQMNIDPYGWTADGSERTLYPAQVQTCVRLLCQPLLEERFKPIIMDNYYYRNHFWFELDHAQTNKLLSLLASSAVASSASIPQNTAMQRPIFQTLPPFKPREKDDGFKPLASVDEHSNHSRRKLNDTNVACLVEDDPFLDDQLSVKEIDQDEKDIIYRKLQKLALKCGTQNLSMSDETKNILAVNDIHLEESGSAKELMVSEDINEKIPGASFESPSIIAQLVQGMEELKAFKEEQTLKMGYLEQKLVEAEEQIQQLKHQCRILESMSSPSNTCIDETAIESSDKQLLDPAESVYLVGGYDGESWLSALDLYFPSQDVIKSFSPMSCVRSYASIARLCGELYIFGGGNGCLWYDTVESYNPVNATWTSCPPLSRKKGSLAGSTLNEKIFAIGGGNGMECFSDVEMLDLDVGAWITTRSMSEKRFALAAVELNGVLYATGGYDGNDYLRSVERFDPREHSWTKIASMNTKRGCHSLVVLDEKLYALGGFDGNTMVSSTEIYDLRLGSWMSGEPMHKPRGYSAAAVVKETIHVFGGVESDDNIIDTVEYFKMGQGWQENTSKAIGKRCFLSAVAL